MPDLAAFSNWLPFYTPSSSRHVETRDSQLTISPFVRTRRVRVTNDQVWTISRIEYHKVLRAHSFWALVEHRLSFLPLVPGALRYLQTADLFRGSTKAYSLATRP